MPQDKDNIFNKKLFVNGERGRKYFEDPYCNNRRIVYVLIIVFSFQSNSYRHVGNIVLFRYNLERIGCYRQLHQLKGYKIRILWLWFVFTSLDHEMCFGCVEHLSFNNLIAFFIYYSLLRYPWTNNDGFNFDHGLVYLCLPAEVHWSTNQFQLYSQPVFKFSVLCVVSAIHYGLLSSDALLSNNISIIVFEYIAQLNNNITDLEK